MIRPVLEEQTVLSDVPEFYSESVTAFVELELIEPTDVQRLRAWQAGGEDTLELREFSLSRVDAERFSIRRYATGTGVGFEITQAELDALLDRVSESELQDDNVASDLPSHLITLMITTADYSAGGVFFRSLHEHESPTAVARWADGSCDELSDEELVEAVVLTISGGLPEELGAPQAELDRPTRAWLQALGGPSDKGPPSVPLSSPSVYSVGLAAAAAAQQGMEIRSWVGWVVLVDGKMFMSPLSGEDQPVPTDTTALLARIDETLNLTDALRVLSERHSS